MRESRELARDDPGTGEDFGSSLSVLLLLEPRRCGGEVNESGDVIALLPGR